MNAPLENVRVVELGQFVAAPLAGMVLANLGADVIKVEPHHGDGGRGLGPPFLGEDPTMARLFAAVNRSKRSIAVDLRAPEGLELVERLLANADVMLTNYRYGALERLGLELTEVSSRHPRLVVVAVSSFGGEKYRDIPGVDITVTGMSGLMMASGIGDDQPMRAAVPFADITAGQTAAGLAMATLLRRETTGRGGVVTVPMLDNLMYLTEILFANDFEGSHVPPAAVGNSSTFGLVDCISTSDGWVTIAAPTDRLFLRLIAAIGREDLIETYPAPSDRNLNRPTILKELATHLAAMPTEFWLTKFRVADVPCGPVYTPEAVLKDGYVMSRQLIDSQEDDEFGTVPFVRFPFEFDGEYLRTDRLAPRLGEHTESVLEDAGYDESERARLLQSGIASSARSQDRA